MNISIVVEYFSLLADEVSEELVWVDGDESAFDLEDLIDPSNYHRLVREAYAEIPNHPAEKNLPEDFESVVEFLKDRHAGDKLGRGKIYEEYFKAQNDSGDGDESWGSFSKKMIAERVADWLRNGELDDDNSQLDATLERLGRLIDNLAERFAKVQAVVDKR